MKKYGFSLAEALITLLIISITTAALAPTITTRRNAALNPNLYWSAVGGGVLASGSLGNVLFGIGANPGNNASLTVGSGGGHNALFISGTTTSNSNITTTGNIQGTTVQGGTVNSTGNITANNNITASGTVQGANVTATGTVQGTNVTASGTVQGATVKATSILSAPKVKFTGMTYLTTTSASCPSGWDKEDKDISCGSGCSIKLRLCSSPSS